jgi:DNA-binding transcriptional LysR family regulator
MAEDWNHYRTLLAVARGGTLSAAAAELEVSISTVHRHLADLEATLDTRLFERRGRTRALTTAAEALVERAERIEAEVHGIERDLAGAEREISGRVTLTTTDSLAERIAHYLPSLRERHPAVHLDVLVDNRHYRLGRGEADVALRPGKKPREPDVVAKAVGDIALSFYAATDYLEEHGRPRRKSDLKKHDAVVVDESLSGVIYGRLAAEHTDSARHVLRAPSLLVQAMAVERGVGIAALPCFLMDARSGVERLFRPEPEGPLWLLYHVELRHSARVRAVVDLLAERLVEDAELFAGRRAS